MVHSRADFFRLTVEDLETLDRFAKKSAENLDGRDRSGRGSGGRWRASSTASGCRRSASRPRSTCATGWPSGSARRLPAARRRRRAGSVVRGRRGRAAPDRDRGARPFTEVQGSGRRSRRRSVAGSPTRRRAASCASWSTSGRARAPGRAAGRGGDAGPLDGKTLVVTGHARGLQPARRPRRRSARPAASRPARSRRRPTTSSPARARARSWPRPRSSASRSSMRPGSGDCWRARIRSHVRGR